MSQKYQDAVGAIVREALIEATVTGADIYYSIQKDLNDHPAEFHKLAVIAELQRIAEDLLETVTDENDRLIVELIRKHGTFAVNTTVPFGGEQDE